LNLIYALRPRISAPQRRRRRQRRPTEPAGRHNAVRSRPSSVPRRSQLQSVELNAVGLIGCPATFGQISDSAPIGSPRPAPLTVVRSFVRSSLARSLVRARTRVYAHGGSEHIVHTKNIASFSATLNRPTADGSVHRGKPVPTRDRWKKNQNRQQRLYLLARYRENDLKPWRGSRARGCLASTFTFLRVRRSRARRTAARAAGVRALRRVAANTRVPGRVARRASASRASASA